MMEILQHVAWKLVDIVNLMSIKMKVYEVPLNLTEHDSDIKIKACTQNPSVICTQVLCL